jgi:hypothetical protein
MTPGIRYSKPSGDITAENRELLRCNDERLARQKKSAEHLSGCGAAREYCSCCNIRLAGAECFQRRGVEYLLCSECGHLQTRRVPPSDWQVDYGTVYPVLAAEAFDSRVERIYRPKLDWALQALAENGGSSPRERRWWNCGCGYAVFSRRAAGMLGAPVRTPGLLCDLVVPALTALGAERASLVKGTLLRPFDPAMQSLAASFLCGTTTELPDLFLALWGEPEGVAVVFSVPVFGLAAVLEDCSSLHYARNFDGWFHAQMFTEKSLRHCLEAAGCELAAQWVFGQDALDLARLCSLAAKNYPHVLRSEVEEALGR